MVYTVTLNPSVDYYLSAGDVTFGRVNRVSSGEILTYGGKGINVSVVLARLGVENTALGFAAGFTGQAVVNALKKDGVTADFVTVKNGLTRINVKLQANGEVTEINGMGPEITDNELQELLHKLDAAKEGDFAVLSGSIPKSIPSDIYERILERFSGRGIRFVVDAEGELFKRALKYRPFLVKPNIHELSGLFGKEITTSGEAAEYAKKLNADNVLVSMGEQGATLIDANNSIHIIGTAKGTAVNPVGAGDSMVAGFLAGYIQTGNYLNALELGTAAGGATAFSQELATKAEIESALKTLREE